MKNCQFRWILGLSLFFLFQTANAGLLFNYHQLALKDLDQMNSLVRSKVKESRKSDSGKAVPLKEALQAVYSRPNDDGMIEKIIGPLRSELEENEAWFSSMDHLVDEAINSLKNSKAFKADVQVTYGIFLNNVISEAKPLLKEDEYQRKLVEKIANANIELSKEAKAERNLRMMKDLPSPSDVAKRVLNPPKKEEGLSKDKPQTESNEKIEIKDKADDKQKSELMPAPDSLPEVK